MLDTIMLVISLCCIAVGLVILPFTSGVLSLALFAISVVIAFFGFLGCYK